MAFALSQLWLFNRAMGDQLNILTTAIAEVRRDTGTLVAKLDEYADMLPEPGSLMARAGRRWGGTRERQRGDPPYPSQPGYRPPPEGDGG